MVLAEQHRPEEIEGCVHDGEDDGTVPLPDADQPQPLEHLERLADGRAVHAEPGGQLALGWQLLPGGVAAVEDRVAEVVGDVLVEPAPHERADHPRHAADLSDGPTNRKALACWCAQPKAHGTLTSRRDRHREIVGY